MRRLILMFVGVVFLASVGVSQAGVNARMLRYPDVSATHIAFVYAGDIWVVPRSGGFAHRLSSPAGEESFPRFSPDGNTIAFSGDYDGNVDIYTIPTEGGELHRVTHHPSRDRMLDWTPDGKEILFASGMTSPSRRYNRIFRVSAEGGLPAQLPMPYGEFATLAADGHSLAYQPASRDFRTWKRYRGGLAPDIWLFDLAKTTARNLTKNDANDSLPMWHDGKLYFLSDRGVNMRSNLWMLDPAGGEARQLTHFQDFDLHFPAIGPDAIVFEAGGKLYLFDLSTEKAQVVSVEVVTDESTLRPRVVKVGDAISGGGISPSGKRTLFEARGDLFTVPAEHGPIRDLTRSPGVRERYPAWSPDGKNIAYLSDAGGEWDLYIRATDGSGKVRQLTDLGPGMRFQPFWSTDSTKIAFLDTDQILRLVDVESKKLTKVDQLIWSSTYPAMENFSVSFSSDSHWMAYRKELDNRNSVLMIYDLKEAKKHQLTSGFYRTSTPVFDAGGDYLFCMVDRSFEPDYSDFDGTWIYANASQIAAIPLRDDVKSPMAPRSDEETVEEAKEGDEKKEEAKDASKKAKTEEKAEEPEKKEKAEAIDIDFDGIENRMVLLPIPAGNFGSLASVKGKLIYLEAPRTGQGEEDAQASLKFWDFKKRESKTIMDGVDGFDLSADGKKILVGSKKRYGIIDVAPGQSLKKPLRTAEMRMTVDPRKEWRQIFNDVWRVERDLFYDPAMHGVDWKEMKTRYGALIDDCVTRWDVNWVLGELIGELNTSHSYRGGGDVEKASRRPVGLLGVDWARDQGQWKVSHIVRPATWEMKTRSPLDRPGVDFSEGDYVLAVNGIPLGNLPDPWAGFEGLAGQTVELTVNSKPDFEGAHTILVKTLQSEGRLRDLEWIEQNRRRVAKATNGRVGYVYVPDTGVNGQSELVRQFYPQATLDGLIVDERFNAGGQWPDRFIELLQRPRTGYIHMRHGRDTELSSMSRTGPTVMLINSWAGSGGDAFPYLFRRMGVGPIIGTRTWGGLVGITRFYPLIDGGGVTAPSLALYTPEGEWMLEGHGLEPDIEVVNDPVSMANGGDPQLERAIAEVESLMKEHPAPKVVVPVPGDRTARGLQ